MIASTGVLPANAAVTRDGVEPVRRESFISTPNRGEVIE